MSASKVLEEYCCTDPVMPKNMKTGYGLFGGYVASCNNCNYICGYWECACELLHKCNGEL